METYFHSDPRLEEWVDQITEKIFTVCLLTGVDAEVEFQSGSQIVAKVTHLLQGISMFPSEYLEDGLKQLLEQQLPDSRVINNFPTFQDTMSKMLREGMTRALDTQSKENFKTLDSSENFITSEDISFNALNDELVTEQVIAALASINNSTPNLKETEVKLQAPSIPSKSYGIIRKTQIPEQADRLKHVLSNIFPNVVVSWNLNLMGQTFLAQVEDILVCLHNPELPCQVENLNKEGWKVYVCSSDDLMFPRRLERGIRQIQRLGKQYKIV